MTSVVLNGQEIELAEDDRLIITVLGECLILVGLETGNQDDIPENQDSPKDQKDLKDLWVPPDRGIVQ